MTSCICKIIAIRDFLTMEELDTIDDLDDKMWDPALDIPLELRNLEPLWRKLNKGRRNK